jgi:cysteinyl-tRNA synthetase
MLQLFSTSTQSKVPFQPLRSDSVSIYFCGPTPYNYVHIGNLVTYLAEDIIIRTIRFLGYNVHSAMNFTDIDDKTIRASLQEGIPLHAFTQKYIDGFL